MDIQIITSYKLFPNSIALIAPFIIWKRQLSLNNINFKIIFNISDLQESEYIILDSKYHRSLWDKKQNQIFNDINIIKSKCNKFIYYDTTDSTSSIQNEVLEFVDKYWKLQILKNKQQYLNKFYGGRIFTHNLKDVKIIDKENSSLNDKVKDPTKLDLIEEAWNASFSNYTYFGKLINDFFIRFKLLRYISFKSKFVNPENSRNINVSARFSSNYSRETIKWQRNIIKKNNKHM